MLCPKRLISPAAEDSLAAISAWRGMFRVPSDVDFAGGSRLVGSGGFVDQYCCEQPGSCSWCCSQGGRSNAAATAVGSGDAAAG